MTLLPAPASAAAAAARQLPAEPVPPGLAVLARAEWPTAPGDELPGIPGFVMSSFSPLVVEVAQRCLRRYFGAPPVDPARGERTAVVLASATGDIETAVAIARAVDEGRRVPPLLFFQSNPNAVVGHLTARWGLAGPVVCTIPAGDVLTDALDCASLLITDGDADAALVIVADQARSAGERDHGDALLIGPPAWQLADGPPSTS
jgi:3-oxoacyl-(acyl-carrier-protein) synthase